MNMLDVYIKLFCKDEASQEMESITAGMITKASLAADAIKRIAETAYESVKNFFGQALESFGQYEQLKGGMETFFGSASDTVISNAQRAYQTAGMSANQYMSNVSTFALTLINSVAQKRQTVVEQDTEAQKKALDTQVTDLERALSRRYNETSKALSKEYSQLQKSLSKQVEAQQEANDEIYKSKQKELDAEYKALQKTLDDEYKALQKELDEEVKAYKKATDEKIEELQRERDERLKLLDGEMDDALKAIDDQMDAIDAQQEAESRARKRREDEQRKSDLAYKIANAKTLEDRAQLQREYADLESDIRERDLNWARQDQKKALREQREALRDQYSEQRDQLKEALNDQIEQYKEGRSNELEVIQEGNKQKLESKKESNQQQLEAQKESNNAILESLKKSQKEQIAAMREANEAILEDKKENNEAILQNMREAHQDQLNALKESVAAQKKALESAADSQSEYVEATEEDMLKAAELADMAIRDMADNANKTGVAIESLEQAYKGFSMGNFVMLDNLHIGYKGTRSEMERLLSDAEQIQAKYGELRTYSIDNFADIVEAIHTVQVEMGISGLTVDELKQKMADNEFTLQELGKLQKAWGMESSSLDEVRQKAAQLSEEYANGGQVLDQFTAVLGTTAAEGATTLEGAFNKMNAAWQNWLISLGEEGWDVGESTKDLVNSIVDYASVLVPRIGEIIQSLIEIVQERGPEIWNTFKEAMLKAIPEEWQEKFNEVIAKVEQFYQDMQPIIELLRLFGQGIVEVAKYLVPLIEAFSNVSDKIGQMVPIVLGARIGFTALAAVAAALSLPFSGIITIAGLVAGAIAGLVLSNEDAAKTLKEILNKIGTFAADFLFSIFKTLGDFAGKIGEQIGKIAERFSDVPSKIAGAFRNAPSLLVRAGYDIMTGLYNGIVSGFKRVASYITSIGSWIASHKGPEQYDKRLLVPAGGWIMGGLHEGLERAFEGEVKPYIMGLGESMQDAFGNPVLSAQYSRTMDNSQRMLTAQKPKQLNVILELDRVQFGKLVYQLNNDETQRVGVSLAGGYA